MKKLLCPALAAASLLLCAAPARAQCWDACVGPDLDLHTEKYVLALGGTVALGGVALGISALHMSELGEEPGYGSVAAGSISGTANLALGLTLLLVECEDDFCGFAHRLAAINMGFGLLNLATTGLLAGLAPKAPVQPAFAFDGDLALFGLAIRSW